MNPDKHARYKRIGMVILVLETDKMLFTLQTNLEISRTFWVLHFRELVLKYFKCLTQHNDALIHGKQLQSSENKTLFPRYQLCYLLDHLHQYTNSVTLSPEKNPSLDFIPASSYCHFISLFPFTVKLFDGVVLYLLFPIPFLLFSLKPSLFSILFQKFHCRSSQQHYPLVLHS